MAAVENEACRAFRPVASLRSKYPASNRAACDNGGVLISLLARRAVYLPKSPMQLYVKFDMPSTVRPG